MKQLITAAIFAATAVTVQAETVTVIDGTIDGYVECRELSIALLPHQTRIRAGIYPLYLKDNKYIEVNCPTPLEVLKWNPGKVVVYTMAEMAQLEEAYAIKQRQSAEQRAIKKAEQMKKYGI